MSVKKGDKVTINYIGKLEDSEVFDQSEEGSPLEFVVGSSEIIEGISNGVIGMSVGDKKQITMPPEQAYGDKVAGLEQDVPLADLPDDVGMGDLLATEIEGQEIVLKVIEIKGDTAVLDANHPLAGHTLTFDVELVGIESA